MATNKHWALVGAEIPKPKLILGTDWRYWIFLSKFCPNRLKSLLYWQSKLGSIEALFFEKAATLAQLKVPEALIALFRNPPWAAIDTDIARIKALGGFLLPINSADYPVLLSKISQPPLCLYGQGQPDLLKTPQIAIVGSRKPTHQGIGSAYQFGHDIAAAGITITSGLALGIDGMAHQGALAGGGKTIAVTATGIDTVYPSRHQQLAQAIIAQGAIVTEYPLGTSPKASNFPQRNRIIAGLALGVVVVEAAIRSGSLITAYSALDENREVYALPGTIQSPVAGGCNKLLKEGAKLVTHPKDILEDWPEPVTLKDESTIKESVTEQRINLKRDCQEVYKGVGFGRTTVEDLVQVTGFSAEKLMTTLCELELLELVGRVPGGYTRT